MSRVAHVARCDNPIMTSQRATFKFVRRKKFKLSSLVRLVSAVTLIIPTSALTNQELPRCTSTSWRHNCTGEIIFENTDRYVGGFLNNKRHYYGTYFYQADNEWKGARYEGYYEDDKRHGYGKLSHPSGYRFEGEFQFGERHGLGIIYYPNGAVFQGSFQKNSKHGFGAHTQSDKSKRVGEWIDDKASGEGIFYSSDGRVLQSGKWEGGKLITAYQLDQAKFPFAWKIPELLEPNTDQIAAGWKLFVGGNGTVDELEALRLTAEGMKAAESKNDSRAASVSRNNLAVIHKCSLDPRVRDYDIGERIAAREVGNNSFSSENFIWNTFLRATAVNEKEFLDFLKDKLSSHSVYGYVKANKGRLPRDNAEALRILENAARTGDWEAAKWIAFQHECSNAPLNLVAAEQWYEKAKLFQGKLSTVSDRDRKQLDERLARIQLLLRPLR